MQNLLESNQSNTVDPAIYGHKAYWLSWLTQGGYNVPYAIFIPAIGLAKSFGGLGAQLPHLQESLAKFLTQDGLYDVAVRSSATCEDSDEHSLAGHFSSFLGRMTIDAVFEAVQ